MQIVEYEEKYKEKTIQLLIEVAVNEFGFKEWERWFRIFENQNYRNNNGNCWIAINERDEVIGTISLKNLDNKSCELKNLYVKKEYRCNGLAKKLFSISMEYAENHCYEKIQLDTYDKFHIAMKFYEKNGFTLENTIVENDKNIYVYSKYLIEETISVIVPIYNVERYIKNCVESLLKQTYRNLQIILVDDGSKDNSGKICDDFAKKDKRLEVIHKPNGGLADARNKGMKVAKGKYIAFLDGDDYIYPTFYEDLHNLLKYYNAEIAECDFFRIKENEIENSQDIIFKYNNNLKIENEICNGEEALKLLYGTRLHPYVKKVVVWNKLYRRELLKNIEFPVGKLHEDEYTTFKILNNCKKIVSTNKVLHGYIQTNNSIMRREIKQKRVEDNLDAYIKCSVFFEQQKNKKIEMMCRRRYLENCIELSGKILKSENNNKEQQIDLIQRLFKENYNIYIQEIEANAIEKREKRIIELIQKANKDICVGNYWDELEKIVNE